MKLKGSAKSPSTEWAVVRWVSFSRCSGKGGSHRWQGQDIDFGIEEDSHPALIRVNIVNMSMIFWSPIQGYIIGIKF